MGGMIEQVTDQAAGVVDNAEQSAMSSMGNGSKLLSGFAGSSGSQNGQAGTAGTAGDGKGQEKGADKGSQGSGGKSQGGGDFLSLLKSGVHTRLMTFGLMNIRKLGAKVIAAGAAKVTGVIKKMLTPKVKFKLGAEEHELWVEKGKNRNVVMMASKNPAPIKVKIQEGEMPNNGEVNNKCEKIESEKDDQKVVQQNEVLADTIQAVTAGVGKAGQGGDKSKPVSEMSYEEIKAELQERYKIFVKEKNQSVQQTNTKLLPKELSFGLYGEMDNDEGDNITGHHMPSKAYMKDNYNIDEKKGLALFLEHIYPGKGGRHKRTFTYGRTGRDKQLYEKLSPNDALDFDIKDVRRILKEDGLLNEHAEKKLMEYVAKCRELYPNIFKH